MLKALPVSFGLAMVAALAFLDGGFPILTLGFRCGAVCKDGHSSSSSATDGSMTRTPDAPGVGDDKRAVGASDE
jgi:hypothetical protein